MAAAIRPLRSPGCWPAYAALLVACQTPSAPTPPSAPTDADSDTADELPGTPCEATYWDGAYVWDESLNEDGRLSAADPETWCTYVPSLVEDARAHGPSFWFIQASCSAGPLPLASDFWPVTYPVAAEPPEAADPCNPVDAPG